MAQVFLLKAITSATSFACGARVPVMCRLKTIDSITYVAALALEPLRDALTEALLELRSRANSPLPSSNSQDRAWAKL